MGCAACAEDNNNKLAMTNEPRTPRERMTTSWHFQETGDFLAIMGRGCNRYSPTVGAHASNPSAIGLGPVARGYIGCFAQEILTGNNDNNRLYAKRRKAGEAGKTFPALGVKWAVPRSILEIA